jgi:RNA polymerase sigma-70 factor (ECF subfamily)
LGKNMEESEGIARLKRGDISGLEPLVRLYQLRAVRAVFGIVRDRQTAEDIVQAAFVRVFERIGQFDPGRPFGPWFFRSVINDALKALGYSARQVSIEGEFEGDEAIWRQHVLDPPPSLLELIERSNTRQEIWEALDQLTPPQRAVVVMRYYLDLDMAEITQQIHRPTGTVKWLLYTARERLRGILKMQRPQREPQPSSPAPKEN